MYLADWDHLYRCPPHRFLGQGYFPLRWYYHKDHMWPVDQLQNFRNHLQTVQLWQFNHEYINWPIKWEHCTNKVTNCQTLPNSTDQWSSTCDSGKHLSLHTSNHQKCLLWTKQWKLMLNVFLWSLETNCHYNVKKAIKTFYQWYPIFSSLPWRGTCYVIDLMGKQNYRWSLIDTWHKFSQLTNDHLPVTQVNTQAYTPLIIIIWVQFFLTLIKTFDTFEDWTCARCQLMITCSFAYPSDQWHNMSPSRVRMRKLDIKYFILKRKLHKTGQIHSWIVISTDTLFYMSVI
jgi:hypothetical protein